MDDDLFCCLHAVLAYIVSVLVDILEGVSRHGVGGNRLSAMFSPNVYNHICTCALPFVMGDVTKTQFTPQQNPKSSVTSDTLL